MPYEPKADHSDLTNKEWQIIKPLIPLPKPGGHPRTVDMRSCATPLLLMGDVAS